MLNQIRIILVEPQHPGNIGAVARAMKTMGLSQLVLINPQQFPNSVARAMAARAEDILDHAVIFDNLDAALADCGLILATSAEVHTLTWPLLTPKTAAEKVHAESEHTPVAIVFGCERVGLALRDLHKAHYHIRIPTDVAYNSLNLAQAVQIICYELFCAAHNPIVEFFKEETKRLVDEEGAATAQELQYYIQRWEKVLVQADFFYPHQQGQTMARLMRIFQRARLSRREINLLQGSLTACQQLMLKQQTETE